MALIECSECGHMVSENAKSCPKCGNPIKSEIGYNWKKPILSIVVLLFVLGGVYAIWQLMGSSGKDKDIEITNALSKSIRKYDALTSFHERFAGVIKEGKWGYINKKGNSTFEYQEKLEINEYNKYVGRWRLDRTTDEGQKMRMEIKLKADKSGEFAVFHLKGSSDDVLVFEEYSQCLLVDGVIYLTKNGEIIIGKTPQLIIGSDGLYSVDNQKYVRVTD